MTAPENVIEFYSGEHWGSRWGVVDAAHPTPHKGLDCGLFHGNVDVPALHSGEVVAVAASTSVGHYVTVERDDGLFDTYCHIVPGVAVRQQIEQGERLGRQAETKTEGGADWLGQHTHLCLSSTSTGWATWTPRNLDPTPGVIAVLTGTAGEDGEPIDNTPKPPEKRKITVNPNILLYRKADTGEIFAVWKDPQTGKTVKSAVDSGVYPDYVKQGYVFQNVSDALLDSIPAA